MIPINISQDVLAEIERNAYLYLKAAEIAIICQIPRAYFLDQLEIEESPIYMAFHTGRLKRKVEYHEKVVKLSDQLSSPAMNIEKEIQSDIFLDDNLNLS